MLSNINFVKFGFADFVMVWIMMCLVLGVSESEDCLNTAYGCKSDRYEVFSK